MREIKYRAWHKKRKKYYKVIHLHLDSFGGPWVTAEGFDIIEQKNIHIQIQPEDCIIEQFTGLKDKNGVDVFEGDKLRVPPKDKFEETSFNSFEVFWHGNDCSQTDVGLVLGRLETHGSSGGGYCGYKLIPQNVGRMVVTGTIHEDHHGA